MTFDLFRYRGTRGRFSAVVDPFALPQEETAGAGILQPQGWIEDGDRMRVTDNQDEFLSLGLYNGSFSQGATGTLLSGRTPSLPYWTVTMTNTSGSATFSRTASSIFPGAHYVRFDPGSTSDKLLLASDKVGVTGLYDYLTGFALSGARGGGAGSDIQVTLRVKWYQKDGTTLISTSTFVRDSDNFTLSAVGTIDGLIVAPADPLTESLRAPANAWYAVIEVELQEITAHHADTEVRLGLVFFHRDVVGGTIAFTRKLSLGQVDISDLTVGGVAEFQDLVNIDSSQLQIAGRSAWVPSRVEGFMYDNVPASLVTTAMGRFTPSATALHISRPRAGRAGRAIGIGWRQSAAVTAGSFSIIGALNGANVFAAQVQITSAASTGYQAFSTPYSFTAEDQISINIASDASLTPAGSIDVAADLIVEYEVQ